MNPHLAAFLRVDFPIGTLLVGGDDSEEQLAASLDGLEVTELDDVDVDALFAL